MRYREFKLLTENELIKMMNPLSEGGKSDAKRYLSEVGAFIGMPGVLKAPIDEVDLNNIGEAINEDKVMNLSKIQEDIKKHVGVHIGSNPDGLKAWYTWTQTKLLPKMFNRLKEVQVEEPSRYGWIAGDNVTLGPVDVVFDNHPYGGISIKAEGGITLKSPGMADFGLTGEKGDKIAGLASAEYKQWMESCMKAVIALAKQSTSAEKSQQQMGDNNPPEQTPMPQQGKRLFFGKKDRDFIQYNPANNTFNLQGKGQKIGPLLQNISEQDILANAGLNLPQHRVFGDWYVAFGAKAQDPYMMPFKQAVMGQVERIMESVLQDQTKVKGLLQMGVKPYFYAEPKGIYEVPTADGVGELISTVKPLTAKRQETGINFNAFFSKPENKDTKNFASVEVRFRWRNGLFASNSTIAVQSLKNAEALGWKKL